MIEGIEYGGQTFRGKRVKLDGGTFRACKFLDCQLVYSGGVEPVFLDDCYFEGSALRLEGAAQNTFDFLKSMLVPGSPARETFLKSSPQLEAIDEIEDSPDAFFRIPQRRK